MSKNVFVRLGFALLSLLCLGCAAALTMIAYELVHRVTGSARAGQLAGAAVIAVLGGGLALVLRRRAGK
ncbi:MAG: hypothetical protein H6878_08095 [Rhodobiaceae bacterium]|nr:hypothetical protein [Rhodobiaceae bacterium]MCC0041178.1 hypothetical protein [Rhodobiaceae bacterium]